MTEPLPWWSPTEHHFWSRVERELVALSPGTENAVVRLVRSEAGRFVLTGVRRVNADSVAADPLALAAAVHAL